LNGDYFSIFYKLRAVTPNWHFTSQIFNCDNTTFNNCKYTHIPNSKIHVYNFLSLSLSIFFLYGLFIHSLPSSSSWYIHLVCSKISFYFFSKCISSFLPKLFSCIMTNMV
jgi:hypothetical protein